MAPRDGGKGPNHWTMNLTTPSGTLSNLQSNHPLIRIPMTPKTKTTPKIAELTEVLEKEKKFENLVNQYGQDQFYAESQRRRDAAFDGDDVADKAIEDFSAATDGSLEKQYRTTRQVFKTRLKNWRSKIWSDFTRVVLAHQLEELEHKRTALADDLEAVSKKHGVPVVVPDHFEGRINTKRSYLQMTPDMAALAPIRHILA